MQANLLGRTANNGSAPRPPKARSVTGGARRVVYSILAVAFVATAVGPNRLRAQTAGPLAQCIHTLEEATQRARSLVETLRQMPRCSATGRTTARLIEQRLVTAGAICPGAIVDVTIEWSGEMTVQIRGVSLNPEKIKQIATAELEPLGLHTNLDEVSATPSCGRSDTPPTGEQPTPPTPTPPTPPPKTPPPPPTSAWRVVSLDEIAAADEASLFDEADCDEVGKRFRSRLAELGPTVGFWVRRDGGLIVLCRPYGGQFEIKDLNLSGDRAALIPRDKQ